MKIELRSSHRLKNAWEPITSPPARNWITFAKTASKSRSLLARADEVIE